MLFQCDKGTAAIQLLKFYSEYQESHGLVLVDYAFLCQDIEELVWFFYDENLDINYYLDKAYSGHLIEMQYLQFEIGQIDLESQMSLMNLIDDSFSLGEIISAMISAVKAAEKKAADDIFIKQNYLKDLSKNYKENKWEKPRPSLMLPAAKIDKYEFKRFYLALFSAIASEKVEEEEWHSIYSRLINQRELFEFKL